MSSLLPRPGHGLLWCPLCRVELTAAAGALVCRNHHGFDLAREGYVNLLRRRRRHSAAAGDSAVQLRHRAEFLDAGHFDAIAATIAEQVQGVDANTTFAQWRILDAGFGTGHHLAKLAATLPAPVIGLGLDIAKDAARQAARRWPALAFAVADLWAEWPVHNAAADVVMGIFAPKNFPEAARVLPPGGWLAIAYPGVTVGGAYPLMCVGLGIIFGSMRVINFSSSSPAAGPTRSRRPRFRAPATPPSISSHSPSYRV